MQFLLLFFIFYLIYQDCLYNRNSIMNIFIMHKYMKGVVLAHKNGHVDRLELCSNKSQWSIHAHKTITDRHLFSFISPQKIVMKTIVLHLKFGIHFFLQLNLISENSFWFIFPIILNSHEAQNSLLLHWSGILITSAASPQLLPIKTSHFGFGLDFSTTELTDALSSSRARTVISSNAVLLLTWTFCCV